jgi:hypothetical protein
MVILLYLRGWFVRVGCGLSLPMRYISGLCFSPQPGCFACMVRLEPDWSEWSLGRVVADLLKQFLFLRFLGGLHIDLWFWEVYNLLIQF